MLNIVIPMAGRGSRFAKEGYDMPKPLIHIHGKPMIDVVVNNLRPKEEHRFLFICLREHAEKFGLEEHLNVLAPESEIIYVDQVTEGAACTTLLAKDFINNDNPLMIANSDQWVNLDIDQYLQQMEQFGLDGLIMTMRADDPKWSFVRFDGTGEVCEVVEKEVVSEEATVGIYNFRSGKDYVLAAERMIDKNLRVNNEFYVAPVYNQLLEHGKKIGIFNVGSELKGMYGLGVPADLKKFLALRISIKATEF